MTVWRGCHCILPDCDEWANLDVRAMPICYKHGLQVARAYAPRILADERRERRATTERRVEAAASKRGDREPPVVYYASIGDYIKIGFTTRLRTRLSALRVDELLAIEPGGPELERERHGLFAAERIDLRRENFRPSDRLNGHISALRDQYGLPHWATLPRTSIVTTRQIGGDQ